MSLGRRTPLKRTEFKRSPRRARTMVRGEEIVGSEFSEEVKVLVVRRSRGLCEIPGCERRASQFHHRLRRSQGGPGTFDNALHVCNDHHTYIHSNTRISYENGWLIRRGQPVTPLNAG